MNLVIRNVELDGHPADVRLAEGAVAEIGHGLRGPEEIDGQGGALIPGLTDHHIHLFALAAQADSVDLTAVASPDDLRDRIAAAAAARPPGAWIRATGYHEAMAGELTRVELNALAPRHRLRIQHQTGSLWILNTLAMAAVDDGDLPASVERATGRVWRGDGWLRERIGAEPPPLAPIGARLASFGITAVTDASVTTDGAAAARLSAGELPQRLTLMSGGELAVSEAYAVGPVKVLLDDHSLPDLDDFIDHIGNARAWRRSVAVHCVTAGELALSLAAFHAAGARPGDRIEHGGVIPEAAIAELKALGLAVVTQSAFIRERGDRYAAQVDVADLPDLYRCASLLRAGVPMAMSSDAPYASPDPWAGVAAAADRRSTGGVRLGPDEAVAPRTALSLYLRPAPGVPEPRVEMGAPADLVLLRMPLREALAAPDASNVRATWIGGVRVFG